MIFPANGIRQVSRGAFGTAGKPGALTLGGFGPGGAKSIGEWLAGGWGTQLGKAVGSALEGLF